MRRVDARGNVYCSNVAVDPVNSPVVAAQYWARSVGAMPSLDTRSFVALPQGPDLTVAASVTAAFPLPGAFTTGWTVVAEAQLRQPAGVGTC